MKYEIGYLLIKWTGVIHTFGLSTLARGPLRWEHPPVTHGRNRGSQVFTMRLPPPPSLAIVDSPDWRRTVIFVLRGIRTCDPQSLSGLCYCSHLKQVHMVSAAGLTWGDTVLYGNVWRRFLVVTTWEVLLPSSGWRPGMLLNVRQCTGQPPPQRMSQPQMSTAMIQRLETWRRPCLPTCLLGEKKNSGKWRRKQCRHIQVVDIQGNFIL